MTVKDVLTKRVVTCQPETNLATASALMWESSCGILPVLSESGELAGILTDRDICIALGTRNARPSEITAREVMGDSPLTCKSADDIRSALQTMRECRVRRLPVVNENGRLEGILSLSDIILSVRRGFAAAGTVSGVTSGDLITALQAIHSPADYSSGRATAA